MVRYPKNAQMATVRGAQGGMNTSQNASVPAHYVFQANTAIQIAPSRYSNVRKIVFSMNTGKLGNGTTSTCEMGLRIASTTTPVLTAQKFNLPFSTRLEGTVDYGMQATNLIRPTPRGPVTTIEQVTITANERDRAQILTVEFDRDDADADLFFAEWDGFTDDDDYMLIQPSIQGLTADTGAVIAYRLKSFQCTIVQDDDRKNNSSTDWHSFIGCNDNVETTIAFQGVVTGPRMPFHYVAQDWNAIDSVSAILFGSITTATTQVTLRVFNVTDNVLVFDENFTLTVGPRYYVARSQNFRDLLLDGKSYFIDYLLNGANATTDPKSTGYFCIVQKNFTRTVCVHQMQDLSFTPTANPRGFSSAILFDPAWYSGFGVTGIREKKLFSAFAHNAGGNDPHQTMRTDPDLLIDDSMLASGTALVISPEHTFTGAPVSARELFTDITANDPIDLLVPQRLMKACSPAGNWLSAPGDFPGHMGLYYALSVPRSSEALSQFGSGDPAFDTDIGPI